MVLTVRGIRLGGVVTRVLPVVFDGRGGRLHRIVIGDGGIRGRACRAGRLAGDRLVTGLSAAGIHVGRRDAQVFVRVALAVGFETILRNAGGAPLHGTIQRLTVVSESPGPWKPEA